MCASHIEEEILEAFTEVLRDSGLPVFLKQQVHFVPVKSEHRRTDFVLYFYGENVDVELHIEADGFSTHAATPTQFAGTCKRNRFYVEHGKLLIAFSGKEINSDPFRCAQEAIRILKIIHYKNEAIERRIVDAEDRFCDLLIEAGLIKLSLIDEGPSNFSPITSLADLMSLGLRSTQQ